MNDLIEQIKLWSISHKLDKTDPFTQLAKITEELGELARALLKGNTPSIIDALGDTVVALVILSQQLGLNIKDCVKWRVWRIKGRKGDTDLVPLNTRKIKTWKTSNEPKDNI